MVIALNQSLQDSLSNLLTSTQSQARNVSFNIQFANLQNTVISKINEEIVEAEDIAGRRRELDRINASISSLTDRRNLVARWEFDNSSNQQRFLSMSIFASNALSSVGSGDTDNFSADEVAAFEEARSNLNEAAGLLVEMNDPEFFDGDHATILRGLLEELDGLTAVEGTVDAEGSETTTNDNRQILDLLQDIYDAADGASDTAATLNLMADNVLRDIDNELESLRFDQIEVTEIRAIEAEFAADQIRTKYATFLQAIEIGFDFASQSADRMAEAMDPDNFTSGTVLSFIA